MSAPEFKLRSHTASQGTHKTKQARIRGELPTIPKIETSPRKTSNGKRVGAHQIGACCHLLLLRAPKWCRIRGQRQHGWITRPDGRPGTPMRRRGRAALAAGAKEKATDTYLTLERRDTSDDDGSPPAAGPHSGARPRPPAPPPCGAPARFLRRKLCWLRRGVPGEEEVVGGETKRRRGPQGQGRTATTYPNACGETRGERPLYRTPR